MKFKHLFFTFFACALFTLSFTSCSDDDDDAITSTVVTNLTFTAEESEENSIKGEIKWTKPTGWSSIESLIIYKSDDGITRGEKLAEVSIDAESYKIDESIDFVKYFIIVAKLKSGVEDTNFAKISVLDTILEGIYILNSGSNGESNSSVSFYSYKTGNVIQKMFQTQNGKGLGDTGQDMIVYGSKIYIAVYGSNLISVTDKNLNEIATIRPESGKGRPRNFTTLNGKLYVTMYDGYLAKIDTTTLQIEKTVEVGRYPEYVRAANNKLYVANSGGLDYNTELGYDKTVSVIDANTFTKLYEKDVELNPVKMAVDNEGNIFVISNGNYRDVPNTLQKIDTKTDEVKKLDVNATWMACNGNKLYYIYSQWTASGTQEITYNVLDTKTEQVITDKFISDNTQLANPYSISVDPVKGYVFISTSDYRNNGDMYIFSEDGKLVDKFNTGGLNPMGGYAVK